MKTYHEIPSENGRSVPRQCCQSLSRLGGGLSSFGFGGTNAHGVVSCATEADLWQHGDLQELGGIQMMYSIISFIHLMCVIIYIYMCRNIYIYIYTYYCYYHHYYYYYIIVIIIMIFIVIIITTIIIIVTIIVITTIIIIIIIINY